MKLVATPLSAFKVALALGGVAVIAAAPQAPAFAQGEVVNDTGVYGKNIARADFPGGYYQMIGEREWARYDTDGNLVRTYVEVRRDEWAAEFRDSENDIYAIIDTLRNAVSETDPQTGVLTEFAKISSIAPRGDMPKIALPRVTADQPQWMKDQWAKRFDANQGFRPGATVGTNSGDSAKQKRPKFAVGPSHSTGGQTGNNAGGQTNAGGSGGGFDPFSNQQGGAASYPGGPAAGQGQAQGQGQAGYDPDAPWLAAQGGGQRQAQATAPTQQTNPFNPPASGNSAPSQQQNNPFAPPPGTPSGPPDWAQGSGQASDPFSQSGSNGPSARRPGQQAQGNPGFGPQFGDGGQDETLNDPTTKFDGIWVAVGEDYRRAQPEPPMNSPKRAAWESRFVPPRMIRVTGTSATSLVLENINITQRASDRGPVMGNGQFAMRKERENQYSGSGANFSVRPGPIARQDLMNANFPGSFRHMSGQYRRATTTDGLLLSRDRKSPEALQNRPPISDQFANLTRVFQPSLVGYDPYLMNLLNPNSGQMAQIFEQHEMQYYTFDPQISKNVLYGLRAVMTNTSLAENNRISVTSEAETQEQMARSMGQSVAGIGYNVSKEKAQSVSQRSGTSIDITLARIPRYTLVMDLPNMDLSYFFKVDVENLMNGGGNYQGFFNKYGTHYAAAVTYGGLGFAEEVTSSLETAESLMRKHGGGFDVTATSKTGQQLGNSNANTSNSQGNSSGSGFSTGQKVFRAVGGSGTMSEAGYTVNEDSVAPILYDLRPISELVNPALFDTKGDGNTIRKLLQVRQAIQNQIAIRQRNKPRLSTIRPKSPEAYRITFNRMRCTSSGSNPRSSIKLNGEIVAKFNDSLGSNREIDLISKPVTENSAPTETVSCGQNAYPFALSNKQMVVVKSLQNPVNISFGVAPVGLYDYKTPTFDSEDRLRQSAGNDFAEGVVGIFKPNRKGSEIIERDRKRIQLKASTEIKPWDNTFRTAPTIQKGERQDGSWRIGGGSSPTLVVDYTIERLQ